MNVRRSLVHTFALPLLVVANDGTDFYMRLADKLAGLFQRLHRTEELEGKCIVFAIVRRIVHRQGRPGWVNVGADKGAMFQITLEGDSPIDR